MSDDTTTNPGTAESSDTTQTEPSPDGGVTSIGSTAGHKDETASEQRATDTDGTAAHTGQMTNLARLIDSPLLTIATREYRLAVRSRWALGVTLLFGLFTAAIVQFGATSVGPGRFDAVIATLAELGVYLIPLVALAIGYDAIVGADENGSLELLLSLPVTKGHVVIGTALGRATVLSGAILLGFVPGGLLTIRHVGIGSLGTYAAVTLAAAVTACAMLGIAVLVSTLAREKTHALGISLALWLWVALLHDLVALGAIAVFDLGSTAIAVAILPNPVDLFRVLALSQVDVVAGGFGSVLAQAGLSTPIVVAVMIAWVVLPIGIASRLIHRRRL